jgi:hypothetical protein
MPPQTQQGSATVPPPPSGDPSVDVQAAGNGGAMDRVRQIISRLSGGGTPAIDAALKAHHDEVVAQAQRHSGDAKRYYGMIAQAKITGKNPTTGQPVTPEELDTWQKQADGAWADYSKIVGKAKAAKPIIQQMGGLLKHVTGQGGQAGQGGQQGPQGQPAQQGSQTVPAPPQGAAAPQQTVPPPPNPLQEAAAGEAEDAAMKHSAAQGDLDAESKRRVGEKQAESDIAVKAKEAEKESEIHAQSAARLAEEAAKHKAKMEEIDETAKQRSLHATTKAAGTTEDRLQAALDKSDYIAAKKEVTKADSDYDGAIDRQTTMHENLESALKGDQQAMLSLVANHIGMTLGAQKGARITRAVWDEATSSVPWLQKVEAKFDDRGYLSGVTLAPDQMRQMVALADQKVGILQDHVTRVKQKYADALAVRGRGKTVSAPPDGSPKKIKVTAEDMANAK